MLVRIADEEKKHTESLIRNGEAGHRDSVRAKSPVGVARSICNVECLTAGDERGRSTGVKGVCLFAKVLCTCRASDPARNTGGRIVSKCKMPSKGS